MTAQDIEQLTVRVRDTFAAHTENGSLAGCCHDAAALLARLLSDRGESAVCEAGTYRVAWKRDPVTGELIASDAGHGWVRLADGAICDPARRQFYPRSRAQRTALTVPAGHPDQALYRTDPTWTGALDASPSRETLLARAVGADEHYPPGALAAITAELLDAAAGGE